MVLASRNLMARVSLTWSGRCFGICLTRIPTIEDLSFKHSEA